MSIFRRRPKPDLAQDDLETSADAVVADEVVEEDEEIVEVSDRGSGPYDESETDGLGERLDLGAIWLAPVPGAEVRLEVDRATEAVNAIQLVLKDSAAQIQAFAAPRSGGVWREVRTEISTAITAAKGTVDEVDGAFGKELHVRMPQQGPDGRQVFAPARFVGVDGPRWFLRAVFSGQAAIDDAAAATMTDALRGMVVVRGLDPMAPREMLPMKLPEQQAPPAEGVPEEPAAPDLNPFERGPEITEVR